MEQVKHVQKLVAQESIFISDFLALSETRYPEWFEPKPFNVLPFSSQSDTTPYIQLERRMRQALAGVTKLAGDKYQVLVYRDRLGIAVPFGWASEVLVEFETDKEKHRDNVKFSIYPGNTKGQGHSIYKKPLNWVKKEDLAIGDTNYELDIAYNVKLCHFNKYISGVSFYDSDLVKPLHTADNFYHRSGKWDNDPWDRFEDFMGQHFKDTYDWRAECNWQNNFLDTDRSYFTMSLGFHVDLYIPYNVFREMDRKDGDVMKASEFISKIINAFKQLMD